MAILGIYDGHNACAATVSETDGAILAAVEEERFSRLKNHDGRDPSNTGPVESVRYCVAMAGEPIHVVALALQTPDSLFTQAVNSYIGSVRDGDFDRLNANLIRGVSMTASEVIEYPRVTQRWRIAKCLRTASDAGVDLAKATIGYVPHHTAHAASTFLTAPTNRSLIVSLDGKGDGLCGLVAIGDGHQISVLREFDYTNSLGHLYGAFTVALGYRAIRHEGKVTALAAHGTVDEALYAKLGDRFRFDADGGTLVGTLNKGLKLGPYPHTLFGELVSRVRELISGMDAAVAAATVQAFTEDIVVAMVESYLQTTELSELAVAGGVFANVSINRRLAQSPAVQRLWVHPAMSDAGLAVGAAVSTFAARAQARPTGFGTAFLGPSYESAGAGKGLAARGYHPLSGINPEDALAEALHAGEVVARFDGRAEYGPRALGNRSILAPALDRSLVSHLNRRLKRSDVMPFAPLLLDEDVDDSLYGVESAGWSAQYMTVAFTCTPSFGHRYPAAVHVDGTARPQIVSAKNAPGLFRLLQRYRRISGQSALINTSLNLHEEPIVLTPEDAVRSIVSADIDVAQLGDTIWRRGV